MGMAINGARKPHVVEVVERILELGRLAYGGMPAEPNLTRTQWAALHYFSQANKYSRTASAFCSFHGTTQGTVSETITGLVRRGLLRRHRSRADRRSVRLDLTEAGWVALNQDPSYALDRAVESLDPDVAETIAEALEALAMAIAQEQERPTFGVCRRCRHFETALCGGEAAPNEGCRRPDFRFDPQEAEGLCIGFEPE